MARQNRSSESASPPTNSAGSPESAKSSADWQQHEHIAPPVQVQAQKLLDEAGSPELAKHAVDEAARQPGKGSGPEELVKDWGFASWDEMITLSTNLVATDGASWWVTPRGDQGWMLWSHHDWQSPRLFASFEEARRHVFQGAPPDVS
jgi:hypothetical protein